MASRFGFAALWTVARLLAALPCATCGRTDNAITPASAPGERTNTAPTPPTSEQSDCAELGGGALGAWRPTAPQLHDASALATLGCLQQPVAAIGRCSARVGSASLRLAGQTPVSQCNAEAKPCALTTGTAQSAGRRWIIFHSSDWGVFVDEAGCSTYGFVQVSVVELTAAQPVLYFDRSYRAEYGEHLDCSSAMPGDWQTLPLNVRALLCSESN